MTLLIDIGNSRIKWTTVRRHKLTDLQSAPRPDSADFADFAAQHWATMTAPKKIVIANVAGVEIAETVSAWMQTHWRRRPHFVTAEPGAHGVTNGYCIPERLGIDRWAALVAARKHWRTTVCIVGAGTAITLDVLSADGKHLGGLIMPGIELMRRSLLERSEGIRAATVSPAHGDITLLARDTLSGVDGGTLYAAVAAIDRVTHDVASELHVTLTRVITGGDAEQLLPLLHGQYHHVPDLVLQGLAIIAEAV